MAEANLYFGASEVFVEVAGKQYDMAAVRQRVAEALKAQGHDDEADARIYVKPEDGKAYYTAAEGALSGSVAL